MPILKNAKKALRVSKRKNLINQRVRSRMKTMMDHLKKEANAESVNQAFSSIDKAKKNNLIHKNKAARLKSNISRSLAASSEKKVSGAKGKKASKKA